MSKKKRERALSDNEAMAVARMLRISPQKLNLVAQLHPRQEGCDRARRSRILAQAHRRRRAQVPGIGDANAENNHDLDVDDLVVAEAHVGKALVIKRSEPRGRGRVGKIFKPFAHLTIVVREVEAQAQ